MDEHYLISILDRTEQCCRLLLCSSCNTLPCEIVTVHGQEAILCLSCAEKQYANGKIAQLSMIQSNIKYNKVLALLNRTFRTLYELSDLPHESNEHVEQKKEAIKEGVVTCLNLLRPTLRDSNPITPVIEAKKKIILKKKTFNILHVDSDDENEKENQSISTVSADDVSARRQTARGSNASKRPASSKKSNGDETESPSKRSKTMNDLDKPLPIISPAIAKALTPTRKQASDEGEKTKKSTSLRLTRKTHPATTDSSTSIMTTKLTKKQRTDEVPAKDDGDVQEKLTRSRRKVALTSKSSIDVRNDKGESLVHQAVKKGDIARVKQLIDDGHSVNTIDHNSWTPFHEASSMGNRPLMELLVAHSANINVQGGSEKMTALHEAVVNENSHESIIQFLLENGADPQIKNNQGQTVLDLVASSNNAKLAALFETSHSKPSAHTQTPTAPPPRRRARTVSSCNILFFTGFDKTRKESLIKSVQSIFGRKTVTTAKNVENNVTHIIACGETDRIAFRTINYLRGIVLGKWIVSEKWIDECIKQKQWIDEKDNEVLGSQLEPDSNGCQASRIRHEQNGTLIFDKCQFYLYGQFHTYKKEDLVDLIKITGATLLKREPKLHRIDSDSDMNNSNPPSISYIIYESSVPDVLLDNSRIKHIKLLDFLACIDHYDTQGRLDN